MQAAAGIVSVVNHGMAEALRIVSVERGHDAREFSLVAFGGAGPVHAAALAEELDIPEVVIPPIPGGFSALGLVATDLRRDWSRTFYSPIESIDPQTLDQRLADLERAAQTMLRDAGIPGTGPYRRTRRGLPLHEAGIRAHGSARGRDGDPAGPWTRSPAHFTPSTFGPTATRIRTSRSRWSTCG